MKTNYTDAQLQAAIDGAFEKPKLGSLHLPDARLKIIKHAIAALPEPEPPTVDGKTPEEIMQSVYYSTPAAEYPFRKAASAVLAVFGDQKTSQDYDRLANFFGRVSILVKELDSLPGDEAEPTFARLEAILKKPLISQSRAAKLSQMGEAFELSSQPAEIPWTEWHGGPCPLKDEEIEEWEYKLRKGFHCKTPGRPSDYFNNWIHNSVNSPYDIIAYRVLKWKEGFGPVENQMTLQRQLETAMARIGIEHTEMKVQQARAEKVEAELAQSEAAFSSYRGAILSALNEAGAPTHHKDVGAPALKPMTPQERIKALSTLPQLRPIAEAGSVPEGCVRIYTTNLGEYPQHTKDDDCALFADIRLPVPAEKPSPETFEAHGKTWTKPSVQKPEDDALIEWILDSELEGRREYKADFVSTAKRLGHWGGIAGWRYADKPTPEPLQPEPWTPKVGDVVMLKSGGPKMTVGYPTEHDIPSVTCAWFDKETLCSTVIPTACIQPA